MPQDLVEKVNTGQPIKTEEKSHIGMENAIMRLNMYCEGKANIVVSSELGKGTEIKLLLPIIV